MRIFSAIPVPKEAQDAFKAVAPGKLPIPYVNTENFHVTLNFFGELDTDQARRVTDEWVNGLPPFERFRIEMDRVDKLHHHLVIYIKEVPELNAMQARLDEHFRKLGFRFQGREFRPHVTLGRMHLDNVMFRNRKVADFPNAELSKMDFTTESIVLYESKMLLQHPKYIPLAEHKLL